MSKENEAPVELLDGTYFIGKSIGKGSFGNVFAAHHIKTGEAIAVKFEKTDNHHLQLYNEYRVSRNYFIFADMKHPFQRKHVFGL